MKHDWTIMKITLIIVLMTWMIFSFSTAIITFFVIGAAAAIFY